MSAAGRLRVLDAADGEEREAWLAAWTEWEGREVFAHPAFVQLFAQPGDRALCAVLDEMDAPGAILHPFLLRDLARQPYAAAALPATDVVSPYGYGGPYAWGAGREPAAAPGFWDALDQWSADHAVVAEFIRFPLLDPTGESYPGDRSERQLNVVRSLEPEGGALWMDFEHKVRKNVNKARRSGVTVVADTTAERLDDFVRIYHQTMSRREAGQGYYFSRSFFETINTQLAGQWCYFHALLDGRVVSTELVLVSAENVYSFLGGTDHEAFDSRPNDLLKFEVMEWARGQGKKRFVLGGGYQPGDGIFRYKLAFAPGGTVPFFAGTRVLRENAYEALVRGRAALEGVDWAPAEGYFPAYRG